MTKAEHKTLEQVDQKVDDLILRFDRMISLTKWCISTIIGVSGVVATLILAFKR